jgi:hypothetical protein
MPTAPSQSPPPQITDSSEALLSGRKPPLRLLVRAKHKDGRPLAIRAAVSEGFVVTTRRTRNDVKADIPSIDDPISKIRHMGKETVKKLQDLNTAAIQVGRACGPDCFEAGTVAQRRRKQGGLIRATRLPHSTPTPHPHPPPLTLPKAGTEILIPENCVNKVREFQALARRAEQDGHLRQKLQHVLKLSKEKWEEARDHALGAVVPDNAMRAWYADRR